MASIKLDEIEYYFVEIKVGDHVIWNAVVEGVFQSTLHGGLSFDVIQDVEAVSNKTGKPTIHVYSTDMQPLIWLTVPGNPTVYEGNVVTLQGTKPKPKEINVNEQDQEFADKIGEAVNEFNKLTAEANKRGLRVSLGVQPYNRVGLAPAEVLTAEVTRVVTPRKETPKWEG
jgi:hypothetical protein